MQPSVAVNGASAPTKLLSAPSRFTRQNYKLFPRACYTRVHCGELFREAFLKREHVSPTNGGGTGAWSNIVSTCRSRNQLKAATKPLGAHAFAVRALYTAPCEAFAILQRKSPTTNRSEVPLTLPVTNVLLWLVHVRWSLAGPRPPEGRSPCKARHLRPKQNNRCPVAYKCAPR